MPHVMAMSTDKLIEIPQNQWATLRDLYLKNWPENIIGYYTIDNYIRWIEKLPTIKHLFVYSLNGDWSDGTFAVLDRNHLFLNTLDDSNIRITRLISLLDWSRVDLVSTLRKKHHSAVVDVTDSKNVIRLVDDETLLYYMPKEEGRNLKVCIPTDVTVSKLTSLQVEYVDSVWPKRSANSVTYLQKLSELNSNLCLITNTGKLISWCLRLPSGPLGALQVNDEFKRRGFGSLTLKLMTINLSQLGHDASGCVVLNNIASHKMFKKNGFKVIDNIFFVTIKQTVPFVFE